ncbi:MAG: NAD(P)-binding domain-containing protein [Planctomycetes bacterium]|nr:NAD(P)-binding domain-containing protein [Planctomycetota bacterium]
MTWALLIGIALALLAALGAAFARRTELARMQRALAERDRSLRAGAGDTQLSEPVVDLSRCMGCGTCVRACPEEGVLALVHGQATVVRGARCVGHAVCERECPVGAITVTVKNLAERRDVPVLDERLEAPSAPGLFLAGEVTAHALIKTAIEHGSAVAVEVAKRRESASVDELDLCIVGAGPAGLACALEAQRLGLRYVLIEQEDELGGTVARYPRRKLVLVRPVELPGVGKLDSEYEKEELIELWRRVADERALSIRCGVRFEKTEPRGDGGWRVHTSAGAIDARHACLALGRRGSPRKLGVPGEQLAKVVYGLSDAASFQGRRSLVVGGGDSAVETALALAAQPESRVTLAYRREAFFRLRTRNQEHVDAAVRDGRLDVLFSTRVVAIEPDRVRLVRGEGAGGAEGRVDGQRDGQLDDSGEAEAQRELELANDDVFVLAGGTSPVEVLERSGVSFDPAERPAAAPLFERGTGVLPALAAATGLALAALGFALWNSDYYFLPLDERPMSSKHLELGPDRGLGFALGITAAVLIVVNLLYVVRRSAAFARAWGSLSGWMTSHVATGVGAVLCALIHAAMAPQDSLGGHALWALIALLATGAIGRYVYAYVPRAASGRELELAEVKLRLERESEAWERVERGFADKVRRELEGEIERVQWKSSLLGRVVALVRGRRELERTLGRLEAEGRRDGVAEARVTAVLAVARRAHGTAVAAAHYEDLRALIESWRWLHRWVAALLVVLVALHVVYALSYGAFLHEGGGLD